MVTANPTARPDFEANLLRWSNALLEATLLYLLLAAWSRPREGPAILLPLAAALALPAGLAIARLFGGSTVVDTTRLVALGLASLAWAFAAARLSAPSAFWETDTPRALLLLGVVLGGLGSGAQPLAFWASLLLWWRGVMLSDWQPGLDDTLARLRLAVAVGGAAIGLSAAVETGGTGLIQLEHVLGGALLLGLALLTTALGRRQEMAGWIRPARGDRPAPVPRASGRLVGLAVGLAALLVLALVGLSTSLLSHETLAPVLNLGWVGLTTVLGGLAGLIGEMVRLLPHLPDPPAVPAQPPPTDGSTLQVPDLPEWIGLLSLGAALIGLLAFIGVLVVTGRHVRIRLRFNGLHAVSGGVSESLQEVPEHGPNVVLALVLRLFRGILGSQLLQRSSHRSGRRPPQATLVRPASLRGYYREYLLWATEHGCGRLPGETPDELLGRLSRRVPASAADIALLTTLYVDHRYGGRLVTAPNLRRAERALGRLRNQKPPNGTDQPVRPTLASRG